MDDKIINGINELAGIVHKEAKSKGFWDSDRSIGELLMLVVSEISEALEADRNSRHSNIDEYCELVAPMGNDMVLEKGLAFKTMVKDSFEDEIADAIIRLLDLCGGLGIDIGRHIASKFEYNQSRPRLHGKAY